MRNPESEISRPPRESAASKIICSDSDYRRLFELAMKEWLSRQRVEDSEREKTAEEIELFEELNSRLKDFVEELDGRWVIGVKPANIHLLETDKMSPDLRQQIEEGGWGGYFDAGKQAVYLFSEAPSKLRLAHKLVHELLHFNSFISYQVIFKNGRSGLNFRRTGLEIFIKKKNAKLKDETFFNELNEAVITELQVRFEKKFFVQISQLKDELEEMENFRAFLRRRGDKTDVELAERVSAVGVEKTAGGKKELTTFFYPDSDERKALESFIDEIYEKNKLQFKSKEDVFGLFVKAVMGGQLLPLARAVEKTYGRGSFRDLGELTKSKNAPSFK